MLSLTVFFLPAAHGLDKPLRSPSASEPALRLNLVIISTHTAKGVIRNRFTSCSIQGYRIGIWFAILFFEGPSECFRHRGQSEGWFFQKRPY